MLRKMMLRVGLIGVAALGLGACTAGYGYGGGFGDGYGGGLQYGGYDSYYGDPFGYRSVPYGYAGAGFGWSGDYYYPGNGYYVYDRGGNRRNWSSDQQRYWQQHGRFGGYPGQGYAGQGYGHNYGRPTYGQGYGRPSYGQPGYGGRPQWNGQRRPDAVSNGIAGGLAGVPRQPGFVPSQPRPEYGGQRGQAGQGQGVQRQERGEARQSGDGQRMQRSGEQRREQPQ